MVKVKIERYSNQLGGIGYVGGKVIFVPKTKIGDIVDVLITEEKTKYYRGRINEINNKVDCPYFYECGGCYLRNFTYDETLKLKHKNITDIFKNNNLFDGKINIYENRNYFYYRNKVSLKIKNYKIGYYQERTNDIVEIDNCLIIKESINSFIKELEKLKIKDGEVIIRSNYNDELLIIIDTLDDVKYDFSLFKDDYKIAGVVVNNKCIYNDDYFFDKINNYLFKISYNSFFQVNNFVAGKIFDLIENNITDSDVVLDLYCGVGTLSICAAKKAKRVIGVEIVENAIKNALINKDVNKLDNVDFMLGDVGKIVDKINVDVDTIIFDPPRKGLDENTINYTLNKPPKKIIYVSCNPITLIRDLKHLNDKYTIKEVSALDMFSYSYHCECVCVLERK